MIRALSSTTVLASALRLAVCGLAACGTAPLHPSTPVVGAVRIERFNPPSGALFVGPVTVTDGEGCGILASHGSLENATVLLQEVAAQKGADFVKVVKEIKPYGGRDCVHHEYTLEGLAYRVGAPAASVTAHPGPRVVPTTANSAAPTNAVLPVAPASPPAAECHPACSPGYSCAAGVCQAECNPACGVNELCRADRVCVPASGAASPLPAK